MPDLEPPFPASNGPDAGALYLPETLDLRFEGFSPEAFALLERLREHPHIEQYRKEKPEIRTHLQEPFKRFRDDLVVNWVLPNRLDLETEKNVFSRLLKNDFGAGGCHHHLWMAFYRTGRKRLTDFQLSHSIDPEGFTSGLYVGDYARDLVKQSLLHIRNEPERFLGLVNALVEKQGWKFFYYKGSKQTFAWQPAVHLPDDLFRADGLWFRTNFARSEVLHWKGNLVRRVLEAMHTVWPLYTFLSERG